VPPHDYSGRTLKDEDAVDMSDVQINQTQSRLDVARGQAAEFQQQIDNDAAALAAPGVSPARLAELTQSIQRNVNNLAAMGITARLPPAATPGYTLPSPSIRPRRTNEISDLETRLSGLLADRNV
jgi:hypothetical protein